MVVKNSLKSETIESLSYKISKIETNVFNSLMSVLNKFSYFDGEPTTFTSNKIVFEQSGVKLIINNRGKISAANTTNSSQAEISNNVLDSLLF